MKRRRLHLPLSGMKPPLCGMRLSVSDSTSRSHVKACRGAVTSRDAILLRKVDFGKGRGFREVLAPHDHLRLRLLRCHFRSATAHEDVDLAPDAERSRQIDPRL